MTPDVIERKIGYLRVGLARLRDDLAAAEREAEHLIPGAGFKLQEAREAVANGEAYIARLEAERDQLLAAAVTP